MAVPVFEQEKIGIAGILHVCLECCEAVIAATGHKHHLRAVPLSLETGKNLFTLHHDPVAAQQFDGFAHPCCILYHFMLH